MVKLFTTHIIDTPAAEKPGTFLTDGKTFAKIACKGGYIGIDDIQWEGKKECPLAIF